MRIRYGLGIAALLITVALAACSNTTNPVTSDVSGDTQFTAAGHGNTAPAELVTVPAGPDNLIFWPYTGVDFMGVPQDPVNLICIGKADPRDIRAALLALDGDRTAFGIDDVFPFNATWRDAIGGMQTAYGESKGWVGNSVQLECGDYNAMRFHLRLFRVGDYTLGNAHLDLLIPGTTDHQVISWELAEQIVWVDVLRSGLLDPAVPFFTTEQINDAPFRGIPAVLYNDFPPELRALIGGPPDDVADSAMILTDGKAMVLNLAARVDAQSGIAVQDFVIDFNQVIPKPFCASGPWDYLYVTGPVHLVQRNITTPSGNVIAMFHAEGHLELTPVNPLTDPPTRVGETYGAIVNEHHKSILTDTQDIVSSFMMQAELPPTGALRGRLVAKLNVGPGDHGISDVTIECEP